MIARPSAILAACLLGGQLIGIARLPVAEDRFFCWSPHDSRSDIVLRAWRGESPVPQGQIQERYQLPALDWHSIGNVRRIIRTAENRQPHSRRWRVQMTYRINGGSEQLWEWKPDER
jgi:hypothetical protein